jgi:hypothetical protein
MLFFGGFGSVLPYIVYLSLMWICILIGVRGHFKSLLGFGHPQENKIESVLLIVQHEQLDHLYNVTIKKQKPGPVVPMAFFLSFDFTPVIENILHPNMYHGSAIYAHIIDACGLRAPPRINHA